MIRVKLKITKKKKWPFAEFKQNGQSCLIFVKKEN